MISRTTTRFRKAYKQLPKTVRKQSRDAYRRFRGNQQHPSLRFKRIHPARPIYSVRISRNYRAIGVLEDGTIIWFWIGSHADNFGGDGHATSIRELGGGIAFPAQTSRNDIAAHYCPEEDDETVYEDLFRQTFRG